MSSAASESDTTWVKSGARKHWTRLQPPGENFSVEVPEDGERLTTAVPMGDQKVDVNRYRVRDGWAIYSLSWFKSPTVGESDDYVFKQLLNEFMEGAAESFKRDNRRTDFNCQPPAGRKISQNGYAGIEFNLTSCRVPWRVRIYTRVLDNERELYLAAAAYAEEDAENVTRFLKSFTVGVTSTRSR